MITQFVSGWNTWRWDTGMDNINITSSMSGGPIAIINQTEAEVACKSLGGGNYHLISNAHWMTIVTNTELESANWNSGLIYFGSMMKGHTDNSDQALSVINANDPYDGTGNSWSSNQRRTLNISNGEVIWDIGGNVAEWNSNFIICSSGYPCSNMPYDLTPGIPLNGEWVEFTNLNSNGSIPWNLLYLINSSLNSSMRVGKIYTYNSPPNGGGIKHSFIRGGYWSDHENGGPFSLFLFQSPSSSSELGFGFRCMYTP